MVPLYSLVVAAAPSPFLWIIVQKYHRVPTKVLMNCSYPQWQLQLISHYLRFLRSKPESWLPQQALKTPTKEASHPIKMGSWELTETEAAITEPAWVFCTRSSTYGICLFAQCFCGTLTVGVGSLWHSHLFLGPFPPTGLSHPAFIWEVEPSLTVSFLCHAQQIFWEACSFLKRKSGSRGERRWS